MPNRSRFAPDILHHRTDPDLPGLTARLAAYRRQAFALHIHEAWSVGLVLSGATTVRLSGKAARIEAGSLACIGPGQPHEVVGALAVGIQRLQLELLDRPHPLALAHDDLALLDDIVQRLHRPHVWLSHKNQRPGFRHPQTDTGGTVGVQTSGGANRPADLLPLPDGFCI